MSVNVEKANEFISNIPMLLKAGSFEFENVEEDFIKIKNSNNLDFYLFVENYNRGFTKYKSKISLAIKLKSLSIDNQFNNNGKLDVFLKEVTNCETVLTFYSYIPSVVKTFEKISIDLNSNNLDEHALPKLYLSKLIEFNNLDYNNFNYLQLNMLEEKTDLEIFVSKFYEIFSLEPKFTWNDRLFELNLEDYFDDINEHSNHMILDSKEQFERLIFSDPALTSLYKDIKKPF